MRYEVNAVMLVDAARIVFDDSFEKNKLQQQKEKPISTRRARMVPGEGALGEFSNCCQLFISQFAAPVPHI